MLADTDIDTDIDKDVNADILKILVSTSTSKSGQTGNLRPREAARATVCCQH